MLDEALKQGAQEVLAEYPIEGVLGPEYAAKVEAFAADISVDKVKGLFETFKQWEGKG